MEFKTDALLLRSVDYGENDKMITLLTTDRGKLGAALKGVRKAGARLRFAAQPFCFAEYVLAERSGRHTVVSAALYDGFFPLREDLLSYYAASAVCEICDKILFEGMQGGELLILAVSALKEMCEGNALSALIGFLLRALRLAGYPINAENCPLCGKRPTGKLWFDMESGAFFCNNCARGVPASESTYLTIRSFLSEEPREKTDEREAADGQKRALRLLSAYFSYQTDSEISTVKELVKML